MSIVKKERNSHIHTLDRVYRATLDEPEVLVPYVPLWRRAVNWLHERIRGACGYLFAERRVDLPLRHIGVSATLYSRYSEGQMRDIWSDPMLGEYYDIVKVEYEHPDTSQKTYLVQPYKLIPSRWQTLLTHVKWQWRRLVRFYWLKSDADAIRDMKRRKEL